FCTPSKKGKGVLVLPTVDGNILLGPTATEVSDEDTTTTKDGLEEIITKAKKVCDNIPLYNAITSFSGIRAYSDRHDFIIEESASVKGLINVAGIESPGLTSAPAIAEYVVNQLIARHFELKENKNYSPYREKDSFFMGLNDEDKNTLIKKNPQFGRIVCRCEQITEGEIVRAIHQNPPATTVDGVKRRLRAGMGRCQGGFCQPYITQILARELNKDLTEIEKSGLKSNLIVGDTK
ncbi:MAG: FAD-dependent oxidoreductase, partial [Clostridia bacterium]|nr:FAD-dependent oxidoreductase [Clostridia bacterium]